MTFRRSAPVALIAAVVIVIAGLALNYITLAVSLAINVLLVRFRFVERAFGIYVQEQLNLFLVWAIPLIVLVTAASVILVALA